MVGWSAPTSSSPQIPSTPGPGQRPKSVFDKTPNGIPRNPFAPNFSTTPAGPPPSSSAASFTPADPPPSSVFGGSQLGSGKSLFKSRGSNGSSKGSKKSVSSFTSSAINKGGLVRMLDNSNDLALSKESGVTSNDTFVVPHSSPTVGQTGYDDDGEEYTDEDAEGSDDAMSDEGSEQMEAGNTEGDSRLHDQSLNLGSIMSHPSNGTSANGLSNPFNTSFINATPRGVKRSRGGASIYNPSSRSAGRSFRPKHDSAIPSIAKSIASRMGVAPLNESDEFIVETERILQKELYGTESLGGHDQALSTGLPDVAEKLSRFWRSSCTRDAAFSAPKQVSFQGIGPDESALPMHKATFLGALQLQLHHPPTAKGKQALAVVHRNRSSLSTRAGYDQTPPNPTAFPGILVEWLNHSHNPYEAVNVEVLKYHPNPTAHGNYWDIIFSLTLRGKLGDVIHLFQRSNFVHARSSREDRKDDYGYSTMQIRNIERVINRAIQVCERCPSLQEDDWNVTGNDWILFRNRVEQELHDLATFSEGRDRDNDPPESSFEASNFGLRSTKMGLSQSARKAESQVPWTVYQNLKTIYGILLGGNSEILAMAQDWVEATVGLTIWWAGEDDEDVAVGSVALTRHSLHRSQTRGTRLVDVNANAAYLRRLANSFELVTDGIVGDGQLAIDTLNPIEVGLASIFQDNFEGMMGLIRAFSLPVAAAVAEVASLGGWFESRTGTVMNGLDESDLLMLSGPVQHKQFLTRDAISMEYAEAVSERDDIRSARGAAAEEGWELSISILTRLEDETLATRTVKDLLQRLPRDSDERVDKILRTCGRFGIIAEARGITEEYADHVAETTDNYGTALFYYARAQAKKKVKDVLDLLISLSLVQSLAFPILSDMDPNLHALIFSPEQSLEPLRKFDPRAAEMLHMSLTGYAALRRFYDLRDQESTLQDGEKPHQRPLARKTAAVGALIVLINSAADNIQGGLYNKDSEAVVQVGGLLALLGEATVFVNQVKSLLSLRQCFALLKAIEDLETVAPRVYAECEKCFRSTLAAYESKRAPASPRALLKKTMSSMTSAGSFSLVNSSMLDSESSDGMGSSKALAKSEENEKRGWDWRKGLERDAKGSDVLRILRLGLAREIARHMVSS